MSAKESTMRELDPKEINRIAGGAVSDWACRVTERGNAGTIVRCWNIKTDARTSVHYAKR